MRPNMCLQRRLTKSESPCMVTGKPRPEWRGFAYKGFSFGPADKALCTLGLKSKLSLAIGLHPSYRSTSLEPR